MAVPITGKIATGSDSLQEIIPASQTRYTRVEIWNRGSTNPASVVFGTDSDNYIPVPASGHRSLDFTDNPIQCKIQAINLDSGANFANLFVTVW